VSGNYALTHAAAISLKRHIEAVWGSDLYTPQGVQTREGYCPDLLRQMLTYNDKEGNARVFGPCKVNIGRIQEDPLNLSNSYLIPSAGLEIVANDYEEIESWRHSITRSQDPGRRIGPDYPIMVGGEHGQVRRFIVKMTTYFIESDQSNEEVSRLTSAASSFIESLCTASWEMPNSWGWRVEDEYGQRLKDPFGETPYAVYTPLTHTRVRGGPPTDYITDIKCYVEMTSYKEVVEF
jgi:hypothetical protein